MCNKHCKAKSTNKNNLQNPKCRAGSVVAGARRMSSDNESSRHPDAPSSLKKQVENFPNGKHA